jgi:hypothetical protein
MNLITTRSLGLGTLCEPENLEWGANPKMCQDKCLSNTETRRTIALIRFEKGKGIPIPMTCSNQFMLFYPLYSYPIEDCFETRTFTVIKRKYNGPTVRWKKQYF